MPQLRKQLLEPLRLPTRFDPHSHGPLQPSVKGPHLLLSLVTQRPLQHLSRRLVPHDNLLIARMKITAYNLHRSAPSSRALVAHHAKSTRVQGADLVMKSNGIPRSKTEAYPSRLQLPGVLARADRLQSPLSDSRTRS